MSTTARASDAEAVGNLIKALNGNLSFKNLQSTFLENTELKTQIEGLKSAHSINTKLLVEAQASLQSTRKIASEKSASLEAKDKEREILEGKLDAARAEREAGLNAAKAEREAAKKKLDQVTRELEILRGFAVTLKPVSSEVNGRLQVLFDSARRFAGAYFGERFEDSVLEEASRWEEIKKQAVTHSIPFLASNTPSAMHMRVAAVLRIVSEKLDCHIFHPVYLSKEDKALSKLMAGLANNDGDREMYLRSVLLKSIPEERQNRAAQERVKSAVDDLVELFDLIFSGEDRASFVSAVEKLCGEACSHWRYIQRVEDRIRPHFTYHSDDIEDWAAFSLKSESPPGSAGPNPKSQPNGNTPASGGSSSKARAKQYSEADRAPRQDMSEIVLWPSFIASSDTEALAKGYVLRKTHLHAAQEEEKRQRPRRQARRDSRGHAITKSTVGSDDGVAGSSGANTAGGSFLSKAGGGQKNG